MKRLLVLVVIAIGSGSLFAQQPAEFPLHVGDYWIYNDIPIGTVSREIVSESLMPNGKHYFGLKWDGGFTEFFRQVGDSVFYYDSEISDEYLYYRFDADSGNVVSEFVFSPGDTFRSVLTGKWTGVYLEKNRRAWSFYIDRTGLLDDDTNHIVRDSLGLTWLENPTWFTFSLRGAMIGGTTYGEITALAPEESITPSLFLLQQNYPNPFNPSTQINFHLGHAATIELSIYDSRGGLIKKLAAGNQSAGNYEIEWDGRNALGNPVGSGVYYARLSTKNSQQVRKMLLVR